jgi:hypothetical protein
VPPAPPVPTVTVKLSPGVTAIVPYASAPPPPPPLDWFLTWSSSESAPPPPPPTQTAEIEVHPLGTVNVKVPAVVYGVCPTGKVSTLVDVAGSILSCSPVVGTAVSMGSISLIESKTIRPPVEVALILLVPVNVDAVFSSNSLE